MEYLVYSSMQLGTLTTLSEHLPDIVKSAPQVQNVGQHGLLVVLHGTEDGS
jgi:hypothetical protein